MRDEADLVLLTMVLSTLWGFHQGVNPLLIGAIGGLVAVAVLWACGLWEV